jgi:hypothetical protein
MKASVLDFSEPFEKIHGQIHHVLDEPVQGETI